MLIFESLIICLILAVDVFIICFNYGLAKIKFPLSTVFSITSINLLFAFIGVIISYFTTNLIPEIYLDYISIFLLFLIGAINLIKFLINSNSKEKNFDKNSDLTLSPKEGLLLSLLLVPDGFCASLGCGKDILFSVIFLLMFFVSTFLAIFISSFLGYRLSRKVKLNLKWLSPVCLLIFSVTKLVILLC